MKTEELQLHVLKAPILIYPGYEEDFKEHKQKVIEARQAKLAKGDFSERATDLEVALYCSSVSLAMPPSKEQHDIYIHAFRKVYGDEQTDRLLGKDVAKTLDPQEKKLYEGLAEWIFTEQAKYLKSKAKVEEKVKL